MTPTPLRAMRVVSNRISLFILCFAAVFLGSVWCTQAQKWISLQEGDVRIGDGTNTVNTAGTLITSSYITQCTYIRAYTNKNMAFNNSAELMMGCTSFGPDGDVDASRLMAGFDLTPIADYVGAYAYTIDDARLVFTYKTAGITSWSMSLLNTTAFDETNATWNVPGGGAIPGGDQGTAISSGTATNLAYPNTLNFNAPGVRSAIQVGLANPTNKAAFFMLRRGTENRGAYYNVFVNDENTDVSYGGTNSRPELQVRVTILSNAPLVSVTATDPAAGEAGGDPGMFTITRSLNTTGSVSVAFSFSGSATWSSDYTYSGPSTVVLGPGVTSTNININVVADLIPEDNETVTLTIAPSANYGVGVASATVTIADDNDGRSLAQYFFGNSFSPQVWNPNLAASTATYPGLSASFGGLYLSTPSAFTALNSITSSSESQAVQNSDYISMVLAARYGFDLQITNIDLSTLYYKSAITSVGTNATLFIRSSIDGFGTNIASITNIASTVSSGAWTNLNVPLGSSFNHLNEVEFRCYIYDDTDSGDAGLRLDNVYFRGEVNPLGTGEQQVAILPSANADETGAPGTFTITRVGDTSSPLDVYFTVGGTATKGADYSLSAPVDTVSMAAGETTVVISVLASMDSLIETNETVSVTITPKTQYRVFGGGSATVTIIDGAFLWRGGATSGDKWSSADTNWIRNGAPSAFVENGYAIFDDGGTTHPIVEISEAVNPSRVLVTNATAYTFRGVGKISGTNSLTKAGNGTLILETANDYSGSTLVNAGALRTANTNGSATGSGQVIVANKAYLEGTGTVQGPVTIQTGGYLSPGVGSLGILGIQNTLVLNGIARLGINRSATNDVVAGVSTLQGSGTLLILNSGSQALQPADSFTIFPGVTSTVGQFTFNPAFPDTNSVLAWDTNVFARECRLLVHRQPIASNFTAGAQSGASTPIQIIGAKYSPVDPDGDPLKLVAAVYSSGKGALLSFDDHKVFYTPAPGFSGEDTFTYAVSDERGGLATASVTINVDGGESRNRVALKALGNGTVQLQYAGIPEFNYALDWCADLTTSLWIPVVTNRAGTDGMLFFTNTPSGTQGFYRTRYVP